MHHRNFHLESVIWGTEESGAVFVDALDADAYRVVSLEAVLMTPFNRLECFIIRGNLILEINMNDEDR